MTTPIIGGDAIACSPGGSGVSSTRRPIIGRHLTAVYPSGREAQQAPRGHSALGGTPLKGFHLTNGGGQDAILWYDRACQDRINQRRNPCPPHRCMIARAST